MMIFAFGIRTRGEFAWDHLPVHVVPSHVMGTFGTNRIYSVGRMVKVADRMRWGVCSRAGSIPSISQM